MSVHFGGRGPGHLARNQGGSFTFDFSSSSQREALNAAPQQRIMNNGTATVWCKWGDSSVTATTSAGFPVGPSTTEVLTPPVGATYIAVIAAGSTGKIYFTPGIGL